MVTIKLDSEIFSDRPAEINMINCKNYNKVAYFKINKN